MAKLLLNLFPLSCKSGFTECQRRGLCFQAAELQTGSAVFSFQSIALAIASAVVRNEQTPLKRNENYRLISERTLTDRSFS